MKLFGNSKYAARVSGAEKTVQKPGDALKYNTRADNQGMDRKLKTLIVFLSVLLILLLSVALFLKLFVQPPNAFSSPISLETIDPDTDLPIGSEMDRPLQNNGVFTILMAGTDHDGYRTDTIMLATLNVNKNSVNLISIPRDTLIEAKSGHAKINSVYGVYGTGKKGMEALMLEIEDILGILPTGYILVDLNGFVKLVDAVGGVDYDVPQNMNYDDPTQDLYIHLQKGYQHLDGDKAMQLVRFRSYAQADIQRTKVQQDFVRVVLEKCLSLENIGKIGEYCEIFDNYVLTSFSTGNLLYFAQEISKCDLTEAMSVTLPGSSVWVGGESCYKLRDAEVKKIIAEYTEP